MHHALRLYSINPGLVIRFYMFGAKFTNLPIIGALIRTLINRYALTQHAAYILTPQEAKRVIGAASSIAVGVCRCRKVFKNCEHPIKTDIVFGVGFDVFTDTRKDEFTKISKEEAWNIIDECSRLGLIQTLLRCRDEAYSICNCCTCCCVPLRLRRDFGVRDALSRDKNIVKSLLCD